MLVQLGRAIAPQVTSTNWTDLSTCRCKRFNYYTQTTPCITEQFDEADESLLQTVMSDSHHVLHHLLPDVKSQRYKLRPQTHSFTLTCKSSFYDNCNFIARTRMLFSDAYWWTLFYSLLFSTTLLLCIVQCGVSLLH